MNIAILGAGGFIGSHLVEHLLARGEHSIVGLDIEDEKLQGIEGPAFTFVRSDVREVPDSVVRDADVVVDLIAYANPSIYVESPLEVFRLNFMTNLEIANQCIRYGKRLIQYSTSEVYGKSRPPDTVYFEDETDMIMGPTTKQRWIYAVAKQLLERVIHAHGLLGEIDYTIVRPFNFIGPRIDYLVPAGSMGGPRVFAHFMSALLEGGPMYLVDGGAAHRTFMSIYDANTALQAILDSPAASQQIYNFGNPDNNIMIRDLAPLMMDLYQEATGQAPRCEPTEVSGETFYGEGYEDMDRIPPDISKLRALGWEPTRDLNETFGDTIRYYLKEAGRISV
ncbi:MAG: NAD-dependent epimerase/dehydratase family protein [Dehalococcoidia bacterium]|nr:NAD-dependent epimerase/dehydratase family protein [Dehalococcoidia bacterium]